MADFPGAPITDEPPLTRRRRWRLWVAAALACVVLAGAFAIWWFVFRSDAPPPATIERAVEAVAPSTTTSEDPAPDASVPSSAADSASTTVAPGVAPTLDGTWTVDRTIGSFDDFTNSWVGYRIDEEVDPIGSNTAAGRTPEVSGSLMVDAGTVQSVAVQADLRALESDSARRDGQLHSRGLETDTFPTASFELTEPIVLEEFSTGTTIEVDAVGDLTLHGVTRPVTVDLDAELVGDVIAVVGRTEIVLGDYGIVAPTGFRILDIADVGEMELQLFFTRG